MRKLFITCVVCAAGMSGLTMRAAEAEELAPMVVEGRSWEYVEETRDWNESIKHKFELKIEGKTTIEGQQYAVVNAYVDNQTEPNQGKPYGYLRETPEGKVYGRANPSYIYPEAQDFTYIDDYLYTQTGDEFLLVDFNDFYASQTFFPEESTIPHSPIMTYYYVNPVNTLMVWQLEEPYLISDNTDLRMVEKVGYVWPDWPCGLLTPTFVFPTGQCHEGWLYLQRVCDADGSVIYEIDNMYSSVADVSVDSAPAVYYDLEGRRLSSAPLSSGIYIRQEGTDARKIVIR